MQSTSTTYTSSGGMRGLDIATATKIDVEGLLEKGGNPSSGLEALTTTKQRHLTTLDFSHMQDQAIAADPRAAAGSQYTAPLRPSRLKEKLEQIRMARESGQVMSMWGAGLAMSSDREARAEGRIGRRNRNELLGRRKPIVAQPVDTVDSKYIEAHPEETFYHRGKGKWGRGLPPPDFNGKAAVRGPGAEAWRAQNQG